ncbi:MAG TPA: fused MFS/spermidine synthase, partial [Anaerolineaceae bacterium]|nr:fused MFS/spermidine synthase [Anaerolineaceae bacterium]
DRSPRPGVFFRILAWSGLLTGLVPVASRPVLRLAAAAFDQLELGGMIGAFVAVLILFIAPITLMGTASPFAIRLGVKETRTAGSIAGRIYAISTLGSFVGTFLPVLILVPLIGTYRSFLVIGGLLLLTALAGLLWAEGKKAALVYLWMPLVLILLAIFGVRGSDKNTTGTVYETESAYNYIQVQEVNGFRLLRLNEGQGMHSVYHPDQVNYYGPWEQVLTAPFFNPAPYDMNQVQRIAIVGLAAGTTARQATLIFGDDVQIDGFEIDPKIVSVGRQYFDMNEPNLNVVVQDGRWALEHSPHQYQIISVDAYRPPYIPWHLTTQEFFQIVNDHLSADGVMVINVGRAGQDRRLVDALSTTILSVFPTVHVMDVPNSFNTIVFASKHPTQAYNLGQNYLALNNPATPALLLETLEIAITNLQPAPETTIVFTDDKASVEWITNDMVVNFLLSNDAEVIK